MNSKGMHFQTASPGPLTPAVHGPARTHRIFHQRLLQNRHYTARRGKNLRTEYSMRLFMCQHHKISRLPGLFGSAIGDHTAPGISGLALREIPGRDRTTPAGRFVGGYGPSIDAGRVLWVDYDSAVSIHPTATGVPAEKRTERLASPSPDDNRITHGCINVSPGFYEQVIRPTFERGGVFYILPDTASLEETFPDFVQSRATVQHDDGKNRQPAPK